MVDFPVPHLDFRGSPLRYGRLYESLLGALVQARLW
ncbi:Uncharacterised protein [Vibrio cholerae]|nr:Uncharacterised protein [Vibrio cholerae]